MMRKLRAAGAPHTALHAASLLAVLTTSSPIHARPRPVHSHAPDPRAIAVLDTAIVRMGGTAVLAKIERVRLDQVVQWLNLRLDSEQHADAPSYNLVSELRDYTLNSTRSTRRVSTGYSLATGWPEWVTIVQDTVAIARITTDWTPLHMAHIDEQRESFATAPERLLQAMHGAADLRSASDTTIGSGQYARVTATVPALSPQPLTLFVRRSDGLPAMARFRAEQLNDAQLAPYGAMDVAVWWSHWQLSPVTGTRGITYPMQYDVDRMGHPFVRATTLAADFNVPATPDSFAVSDSLRKAFLGGATSRPMWQRSPVDSGTVADGRFAVSGRGGSGPIAALVGGKWLLLLDAGMPLELRRRQVDWLERKIPGSRVGAGVVTSASGFGVGTGWLIGRGAPVYVAPIAMQAVRAVGNNWGDHVHGTVIRSGQWIRIGSDSAWTEPVTLPSATGAGAMVVYVPTLHWLYSFGAVGPSATTFLVNLAATRGWHVDHIGSAVTINAPVPPRGP